MLALAMFFAEALIKVLGIGIKYKCFLAGYLAEHPHAVVDLLLAVWQQDIALSELALASSVF